MKYTSEQINALSWKEWNVTMAKELNSASFKARGYNPKTHKVEINFAPYKGDGEPESFILGEIEGVEEIDFLKSIGLLNNGRCPLCGSKIIGDPGRFTNGFNHSLHFQICQNCVSAGRKIGGTPTIKKKDSSIRTIFIIILVMLVYTFIRTVLKS
ncbi:MAG: hypothetical protein R3Y59_05275 [bacterium]